MAPVAFRRILWLLSPVIERLARRISSVIFVVVLHRGSAWSGNIGLLSSTVIVDPVVSEPYLLGRGLVHLHLLDRYMLDLLHFG